MIFIVEGCDCAGKTTFIEELKKTLTISSYFHATRDTKIEDYVRLLTDGVDVPIIVDRCWISEEVYGEVIRGYRTPASQHKRLNDLLAKTDYLIFYLTADNGTLEERYLTRGDDYIHRDQLWRLSLAYEKYFIKDTGEGRKRYEYCGKPVIRIDTSAS